MAKILGNIEITEVRKLEKLQMEIEKLKVQLEHLSLKSENCTLKQTLVEKEKYILLSEIKHKFNIDDLSFIRIKDNGEVIDVSDEARSDES